ncbi:hypothetical protein [Streptomyces scabiei]|uniref:hypothetical protein n=1 Tax=Streptomyces scabiei TaxID=1930 RepID=UPI001B31A815|nr:hypothetical protein [Streptomyces sp. LBUM 1486]
MAQPATRSASCTQCQRRRRRLRAHSPLLNTLCLPVTRWAFTALAIGALTADLATPALIAGALAYAAWRYR